MGLHFISLFREGDGFFKPLSDKGISGERGQSWLISDLVGGGEGMADQGSAGLGLTHPLLEVISYSYFSLFF